MRRKSERNKSKASPEKKVEKPTRKSTRRRNRRSPSTSPEKDVPPVEEKSPVQLNEAENETSSQTRLQSKEMEQLSHMSSEEKIHSGKTEKLPTKEVAGDNCGSVWKVARADASPGEIQKLKLCRQRNISEASSDTTTSGRNSTPPKSTGKWQESGEGVAEEADSADEQLVSCTRMLSSPEQPIDPSSSYPGQDSNEEVSDSKEILPETTSANLLSDDKPNIDQRGESNETNCAAQIADSEPGKPPRSATATPVPSANGDYTCEKKTTEVPEVPEIIVQEDKSEEESGEKPTMETPSEEPSVVDNAHRDSSSEDDEDEKPKTEEPPADSSSDSNDESRTKRSRTSSDRTSPRATRRKHRNKYRDSSNSETADSEDESVNNRKVSETYAEETEEGEKPRRNAEENNKEQSVSPSRTNTDENNVEKMDTEQCETVQDRPEESTCEKLEQVIVPTATQTVAHKPVKVNLKRSFSARISEKNEEKKDDADPSVDNEFNSQNKENGSEPEPKCVARKRRWGTALSTDTAPSFSISTDSLKAIVPGAKPLSINEVRLSKEDDDDRDRHRSNDKRYNSSDNTGDMKTADESAQKNSAAKKGSNGKVDNHMAARRKILIMKETSSVKSPSPPASKPTSILLIKNLVRPFTLNQIKELLSRTGTIVENGFWMDRIKSKCIVQYANEDQAFETRQALHGISWPMSNPKKLHVEYATKEDMETARESSKEQPVARKTELISSDSWQQDWSRDEKTNTTKVTVVREWDLGKEDGQQHVREKEREKKEHEKKRRARSRSPALDAHLSAPARKFKKKEDDPPPAKLLDDLFRKTKAMPCIYWLPLTNEQIVVKEEMRRQHMAEHARRLEEMRRADRDRNRDRDARRRRSPRK